MLRMDKSALYTALGEGVKNVILAPNEARQETRTQARAGRRFAARAATELFARGAQQTRCEA
jgi:hypothetical protein